MKEIKFISLEKIFVYLCSMHRMALGVGGGGGGFAQRKTKRGESRAHAEGKQKIIPLTFRKKNCTRPKQIRVSRKLPTPPKKIYLPQLQTG